VKFGERKRYEIWHWNEIWDKDLNLFVHRMRNLAWRFRLRFAHHCSVQFQLMVCLQCFDTVDWVTGLPQGKGRTAAYYTSANWCTVWVTVHVEMNIFWSQHCLFAQFCYACEFGLKWKWLDVGLLVVMIWLELCTTFSSSSRVVTTTTIILCLNTG